MSLFLPVVAEGEHHNPGPGVGGVELQDILAEVVHRSQAVGVGLLHNQDLNHLQDSPAAEVAELPHILDLEGLQAVQGVGLLDSPEVVLLAAAEVAELPHILDLEGLLAVQVVWLRDSPEVGLRGSPVVGALHFQGMAEQELLDEELPPQYMLLQGSQTSVNLLVFSVKGTALVNASADTAHF